MQAREKSMRTDRWIDRGGFGAAHFYRRFHEN
jgi:hypothetical protein